MYFATPSVIKWVAQKIGGIREGNLMPELFDENGNVLLDEVYKRGKEAMKKSGKVYIDKINYFADEQDLECLYNYIKTA